MLRRAARVTVILATLVAPLPVRAQEAAAGAGDGARTTGLLASNLLHGAIGVFSVHNALPASVGVLATGVSGIFDQDVVRALDDPDARFGRWLEADAQPVLVGAGIGVLFVAGRYSDHRRFRATTYDLLNAWVINGVYTLVLKGAVGRTRPNGEDQLSFPSGHASNAFTLATVAGRHYGWKVGVPAYGVAAAVAASRLLRNAHYLSDVTAGATLGCIVGLTVVRVNGRDVPTRKAAAVSVVPVFARRTRAVAIEVAF
jgi:membrane-associated phospholipid phosphatase